jgi:hypothetical protein
MEDGGRRKDRGRREGGKEGAGRYLIKLVGIDERVFLDIHDSHNKRLLDSAVIKKSNVPCFHVISQVGPRLESPSKH